MIDTQLRPTRLREGYVTRSGLLGQPDRGLAQGLHYLCAGCKDFFHFVDFPMKLTAGLIRRNREAREVTQILNSAFTGVERNVRCPSGSGRKFKHATAGRSRNQDRSHCPHRKPGRA